jgi:prepilin-type processing-associated H-X9-DG protein
MTVNPASVKLKTCGLTRMETLVILAVVIVLVIVFWPSKQERKARTLTCINNLKEIGLGLTMYADNNNGRFPLQVPATNNSVTELIYSNRVFPRYQVASNELGHYPKILICPFDITRQAAADFETLNDSNISYFLNTDAIRNSPSNSILSGDRFLRSGRQSVKSGLFILTTNSSMSWTPRVHKGGGNLGWSDGSVQQTTSDILPSLIQSQPLATNRLIIP